MKFLLYRETWPGSSLYSSRGLRTDMSRPGFEPGPPVWEASTLEKSHLNSLYAGYSEPLLMMRLASLQTSTWLPQCRCIAHGLLSVEGMPEGDSKSASLNRTYCYPNRTDGHVWQSRRGHHYRETWPGSSLYSSRGPRTDMSSVYLSLLGYKKTLNKPPPLPAWLAY
jgi:hypothetical protein